MIWKAQGYFCNIIIAAVVVVYSGLLVAVTSVQ